MTKAIITVGLGWGDEAKGQTTDALVRHHNSRLVVRYSGGSQCGHNVTLPDGRSHCFSQFGSGTLAGAHTYLTKDVIISPFALLKEAEHLKTFGLQPFDTLLIHPKALVTTVYTQAMNRIKESIRTKKHGSCGHGIGETRSYWLKYGDDSIRAEDLYNQYRLLPKLELQRARLIEEYKAMDVAVPSEHLRDLYVSPRALFKSYIKEVGPNIRNTADLPNHGNKPIIYEGAQGVLLDEHFGFYPYTTWSTVTDELAWDHVDESGIQDVSVLGITRSYMTRHGEGPFPTYSKELQDKLVDPHNPDNKWQGNIRFGWFDLDLIRYSAKCLRRLDGLVVNHLDQVTSDWKMYHGYNVPWSQFPTLKTQEKIAIYNDDRFCFSSSAKGFEDEDAGNKLAVGMLLSHCNGVAPVVLEGHGLTFEHRKFNGNYAKVTSGTG